MAEKMALVASNGDSEDLSTIKRIDESPQQSLKDQQTGLFKHLKYTITKPSYDSDLAQFMQSEDSYWSIAHTGLTTRMTGAAGKECKFFIGLNANDMHVLDSYDRYVSMAENMAEYVKPEYTVLMISPLIVKHHMGTPGADCMPVARSRRGENSRSDRVAEAEQFMYMDTVNFVGAGSEAMKVPLIFLYGLQARRGGDYEYESVEDPRVQAIATTTAVVYMQTSGGDEPSGAYFLANPKMLQMTQKPPADSKSLRQMIIDNKVVIPTRNTGGELRGSVINLPLADPGLLGAGAPWLRSKEDCTSSARISPHPAYD
jgi:hypothetical protein